MSRPVPTSPSLLSRRDLIAGGLTLGAAALAGDTRVDAAQKNAPAEFRYCLNTSTISMTADGKRRPVTEMIDLAARAGYQGIEPWFRDIDPYVAGGGTVSDLAKRIHDHGLTVDSAIAFAEWIVDDDARRAKGIEETKRCMEIVAQLGGKRLAAPPAGATNQPIDLMRAAERYRTILELGDQTGVTPMVEVWGFSQSLGNLGAATMVAIQSRHPKACILPDVYHLYRGGSDFTGLALLNGDYIPAFHVNDYPREPPRAQLTDAHRVYPGDGIAPYADILRTLRRIGFRGALSLEVFNRDYWKQDPLTVAKTGLEKLRALVARTAAG